MTDRTYRADDFMYTFVSRFSLRVGGSVRDQLLGRRAKDEDYLVPKMTLKQLEETLWGAAEAAGLTERVSVTPLRLRTQTQVGWRFAAKGIGCIEIALPRKEISTGPGRHDFEIVLDPNLPLEEDAKRRDFTFNALYLRPNWLPGDEVLAKVLDPTMCGLYDLEHKLVRTTHPDSFRDDPLRVLRALRFVSTLGYDLATDTRKQMEDHADAVTGLTSPVTAHSRLWKCQDGPPVLTGGNTSGTVFAELCKLLMGDDAVKALRIMRDTGVMANLLPELEPMIGFDQASRYHTHTTDEHTFLALEHAVKADAPLRVRLALLFHDSGKPATAWMDDRGRKHYYADERNGYRDHEDVGAEIADKALRRLGATRRLRKDVVKLVQHHMLWAKDTVKDSTVGRMRVEFGDDLMRDLILHRVCDACGKGKPRLEDIYYFGQLEARRREFVKDGVPSKIADLQVRGGDLLAAGIVQEHIGRALRGVLDEVVCQPRSVRLGREWQLERAIALGRA